MEKVKCKVCGSWVWMKESPQKIAEGPAGQVPMKECGHPLGSIDRHGVAWWCSACGRVIHRNIPRQGIPEGMEAAAREAFGVDEGELSERVEGLERQVKALTPSGRAALEEWRSKWEVVSKLLGEWVQAFGHLQACAAPNLLVDADNPEAYARQAVEHLQAERKRWDEREQGLLRLIQSATLELENYRRAFEEIKALLSAGPRWKS